MLSLLARYRHIVLFMLFVLFSLGLLSFNRPADSLLTSSNVVERGMLLVLQPFQELLAGANLQIQTIWQNYLALINLSKENQRLQKEISALRAEKNRYIEQAKAFERLEGTLKLIDKREFSPPIIASVIGLDPMNQTNTVIVNRGKDDGVRESLPVITQDGIVGVTMTVSQRSSKVLLLINPNCNVSALIQRTRDQGIVGGQSKKDAYVMKYVNRRANIREGATFQMTDRSFVEMIKEGVPGFKLTLPVLAKLQDNGIPADILTILEILLEREYPTQEAFVSALESVIGREQTAWYKTTILKYAVSGILAKLETMKEHLYPTENSFIKALEDTIGTEQAEQYLSHILPHVKEEETVVSSGLGGIFPKGLLIGTVSKVVKQDYGLFQEIEIAPSVDFSKLEEVLIIRRDNIIIEQ